MFESLGCDIEVEDFLVKLGDELIGSVLLGYTIELVINVVVESFAKVVVLSVLDDVLITVNV